MPDLAAELRDCGVARKFARATSLKKIPSSIFELKLTSTTTEARNVARALRYTCPRPTEPGFDRAADIINRALQSKLFLKEV